MAYLQNIRVLNGIRAFNTIIKNQSNFIDNKLNLLYLNARSLRNKMDQLDVLIKQTKIEIHIVVCVETWLKPEEERYFGLPGYNASYVSREKVGGGVAIYVDRSLQFRTLYRYNSNTSILTIEIQKPNICVTAIYRPPGERIQDFLEQLETVLEHSVRQQNIFVGDINLDILNENNITRSYTQIIESYGLSFLNSMHPTRQSDGPSLIDHVISNMNIHEIDTYLIDHTLSDHRLQMVRLPTHVGNRKKSETKYVVTRHVNVEMVRAHLDNLNQQVVFLESAARLYREVELVFMNSYKIVVKEVGFIQGKEWIDHSTMSLIKKRDCYFRKHKSHPENIYYQTKHKE